MQLHRSIGNRAVEQLLRGRGESERQPIGLKGGKVPPMVESAINRARGGGQPLDFAVQKQMSGAMEYDFSGIRVHTGSEADMLNEQLSAKAFTTGRDIFFKHGTYDPGSSSGRDLIAHELTHVVQQSTGQVSVNGSGMTVRPATDAFEQEADTLARKVRNKMQTSLMRERGEKGKDMPSTRNIDVERQYSPGDHQLSGSPKPGLPRTEGLVVQRLVKIRATDVGAPGFSNGEFTWHIRWDVEGARNDGWIIQYIDRNEKATIGGKDDQEKEAKTLRYWEAWRVQSEGDQFTVTPEEEGYNDRFSMPNPTLSTSYGSNRPHKGNWSIKGIAYWSEAADLPGMTERAVPQAGRLRSSYQKPKVGMWRKLTRKVGGIWGYTPRNNDLQQDFNIRR
jgi:hypothetical protein